MKNRLLTYGGYLSLLTYGLANTTAGPALDHIQRSFAVTSGQVGFIFTTLSMGFIVAVLLSGYFIDRFSLKLVSVTGQFLLPLGLLLFGCSNSFTSGCVSFFIIGLGGGLIEISTNTLIATLYSDNRASSLSLLHLFFGFGALSGPFIAGFMIQSGFDWRTVFFSISLFSFLVMILMIFPSYPKSESSSSLTFSTTLELVKKKYMILICLAVVIYVGIEMAINSWSVVYMEQYLSLEKLTASSILSYFWIMMTLGRMLCAYLSRHFQPHNLLIFLVLLACVAYPIFIFTSNKIICGAALALVGLSFSGIFPILVALNSNRFPDKIGSSTGILMSFMGVGLMTFPWLTGVVADIMSLQWSLRILTGAIIVLLITVLLIKNQTESRTNHHEN
jgi:MFS transporter, FHS family, glucose/mannose:H+ symporter